MIARALVLGVALAAIQEQPVWRAVTTEHFEIHYVAAASAELDRVTRRAERAYGQVSARLHFVLARRVPLVVFAPSGPVRREDALAFAISDAVAPQTPHRSRIVLPIEDRDAEFDASLVHELTHLLSYEILLPGRGGDGGLPRWVSEGLANYMAGVWSADETRFMREIVASGRVPALSQLAGDGGFTNARSSDAIGHAAFDFIEARWGPNGIRQFWDALIVPRVDRTYDSVLNLTPTEFDAAFREYAAARFSR
jgi:hypothetical protein